MSEYTKAVKRSLREYAQEAYERELHRELLKLDESFAEWRRGRISSGELSHRIHLYESGPAQELYNRYNGGDEALNVAYAIVTGILCAEEITPELMAALERPLGFFQSLKEQGELREPGE